MRRAVVNRPVVLFTNSMVMGGMEEHVLQLARGLIDRGVRVAVICSPYEAIRPLREQLSAAGATVHALPDRGRPPLGTLRRLQALVQAFRQYLGCIVHLHFTGFRGGDLVLLAARLAGARAVVRTVHLPPVPPISRADRWLIHVRDLFLDRIICVSQATRQAHLDLLGRDPNKCVVVHNAVDLQRFTPTGDDGDVRAELGLPDTVPVIGTVSRLGEQRKGIAYFIDMASHIAQKHPTARFLIVGDGDLRPDLERQAAEVGIRDRVVFAGERSDIPRLLRAMTVFVMPSLYEAGPYTVLEAMATGVAVVSTLVGLVPEAIEDGVSGRLVGVGDAVALAIAVGELLDRPDVAGRLANAGLRKVGGFSAAAMLDRLLDVYANAVGECPPSTALAHET